MPANTDFDMFNSIRRFWELRFQVHGLESGRSAWHEHRKDHETVAEPARFSTLMEYPRPSPAHIISLASMNPGTATTPCHKST